MSRTKLSGAARRRRMKATRLHHEQIIYQQEDPVVEQPRLDHLVVAQASGPIPTPVELVNPTVSSPLMDDVDVVVIAIHPAPEPHQQKEHQQPQQQEQLQPRPHDEPRGRGNWKGPQHTRNFSIQHAAPCSYQHNNNRHLERRVSYPPSASNHHHHHHHHHNQHHQNYCIQVGETINLQAYDLPFTMPHDDFAYHHGQARHGNSMSLHPYEPQHQQQQVQLQQQFGGYSSPNSSDEGSLKGDYSCQGGAGDYMSVSGEQTNYYSGSSYPYHHEQHEQPPDPHYDGPLPPPYFAFRYTTMATGISYHRYMPSSSYDSQASYSPFYGNPQPHGGNTEASTSPHYYQQQQLQEGMRGGIEGGMNRSNFNPPHPDMIMTAVIQQGSSNSKCKYSNGTDEDMKAMEQHKRGIVEQTRERGSEKETREEVLSNGVRKITRGELTHYIYPEDVARMTQEEIMMEMSASSHILNANLPLERQQHHPQQFPQHHYHHHHHQQHYQCYTPPGSPPVQPYQNISPPYSPVTTPPVMQYEKHFLGKRSHPQSPQDEEQQVPTHYNGPPSPLTPAPCSPPSYPMDTTLFNDQILPHSHQSHRQLQKQIQSKVQEQQQQKQQQSPGMFKTKSPPPILPAITEGNSMCPSLPPCCNSLDKSGGSSSCSDSENSKGGKKIRSYRTKRRGLLRTATNNTRNKFPSEKQQLRQQHQQQNQPKWNGFPRMPLFSTTDYAGKAYTFYRPDDYQDVICYPTRFFHCPQPPLALPAREMERRGLPYGPTYGPLAPWHFPYERPQPVAAEGK
ncbi:Hypothetical protein NocV09_00800150 [Nannochloropsis oceanica]